MMRRTLSARPLHWLVRFRPAFSSPSPARPAADNSAPAPRRIASKLSPPASPAKGAGAGRTSRYEHDPRLLYQGAGVRQLNRNLTPGISGERPSKLQEGGAVA